MIRDIECGIQQKETVPRKRNVSIDITRFLLAVFVVAIHYPPGNGYLGFVYVNIIARVANPLFFAISSYLFFYKNSDLAIDGLKRYCIRLIRIYGIWGGYLSATYCFAVQS